MAPPKQLFIVESSGRDGVKAEYIGDYDGQVYAFYSMPPGEEGSGTTYSIPLQAEDEDVPATGSWAVISEDSRTVLVTMEKNFMPEIPPPGPFEVTVSEIAWAEFRSRQPVPA